MEEEVSANEANAQGTPSNDVAEKVIPKQDDVIEASKSDANADVSERLLQESKQWKRRAQDAEKALKASEESTLKEQSKYKELWERERSDKETLAKKVLEDKKKSALYAAASKYKCVDVEAALKIGNQGLLQYDQEVDDFVGVDSFFEDLRGSKSYLFDHSARSVQSPRPGGIPKEAAFDELSLDEKERVLMDKLKSAKG